MVHNPTLEYSRIKHPALSLGAWSAVTATFFTLLFVLLMLVFAPAEWSGIEAYATTFASLEMAQFIPLILLAPTVVILMACIHHVSPDTKKVFSLASVAFSSIYAAIICTNYYIQLYAVRLNLLNVDLEGLYLLAIPNPRSIFVALETIGYAFLSLSMLLVSSIFTGGRLESWIRWLFIISGAFGLFSAIIAPFDQPILFYTGFGLSLLVFPMATFFVILFFKKFNTRDLP